MEIQRQALSPKEAAAYLGMSTATLQRLRTQGLGAKFLKVDTNRGKNRKVLYPIKELDKFLENVQQTA
jgi:hypothetical protein